MNFSDLGSPRSRAALRHVADSSTGPALDPDVRVTLNFHPDRLVRTVPILRALADDGTYHSQFVTGTGNGGLTFPKLSASFEQGRPQSPAVTGGAGRVASSAGCTTTRARPSGPCTAR